MWMNGSLSRWQNCNKMYTKETAYIQRWIHRSPMHKSKDDFHLRSCIFGENLVSELKCAKCKINIKFLQLCKEKRM